VRSVVLCPVRGAAGTDGAPSVYVVNRLGRTSRGSGGAARGAVPAHRSGLGGGRVRPPVVTPLGPVPPGDFVPVAEDSGLIREMGEPAQAGSKRGEGVADGRGPGHFLSAEPGTKRGTSSRRSRPGLGRRAGSPASTRSRAESLREEKQAVGPRAVDGLPSRRHAELAVDRPGMGLHGAVGHGQLTGDLVERPLGRQQSEHRPPTLRRAEARPGADDRRARPAAHADRRARGATPAHRRSGTPALPHPDRHPAAPEHRGTPVARDDVGDRRDRSPAARPPALLRLPGSSPPAATW
jgi:hypothetical protein